MKITKPNYNFRYIRRVISTVDLHIVTSNDGYYYLNLSSFGKKGGLISEQALLIMCTYLSKKNRAPKQFNTAIKE